MTDELIIDHVLSGNTHIFSEIVNRYKDKVFNMMFRFTNNYSDAQDLSQETFIHIFKNLHSFNGKSKFSTWLYRISYNLCIDWTRKNKKRLNHINYSQDYESHDIIDENFNLEEKIIDAQRRSIIIKEINYLPEKYKAPLILFHYQGLSYSDISEIIKVPVKTVETRLYRARNQLRKNLGKHGFGGEYFEMQADNQIG